LVRLQTHYVFFVYSLLLVTASSAIYTLSLHDALPIFLTHVFFCVSKNVSVSCAYTQGKREQFSGFNRTLDAINNVFERPVKAAGDRKSGSAGMPRPISYAVFCLKKKKLNVTGH